jgi:Zn-dependent protease
MSSATSSPSNASASEPKLPVFPPGFGAYVRWQALNVSLDARALISLAGLFAAIVCLGLYHTTRRPVFAALAHTGAWLNLLNLIPVWILDGGRAVHALSQL